MADLPFTKIFLIAYTFTYIIVNMFNLPLNFLLTPAPSTSILSLIPNMFIFIVNFITFTTGFVTVDIILWVIRIIVLLELLPLLIDLASGIGGGIAKFF